MVRNNADGADDEDGFQDVSWAVGGFGITMRCHKASW